MRTPEDPCRDPASEARDDHASEPRATPETDGAYLVIRGSNSIHVCDELGAMASFARRLERQRDELLEALEACRHDSCELLGERNWWKDEHRCDYRKRYEETAANIVRADAAIAAVKGGRHD